MVATPSSLGSRGPPLIHVEHTPLPPDTTAAKGGGYGRPPTPRPQAEEGTDVLGVPLAEAELVHLINPQPSTLNPERSNAEPGTRNHEPYTRNTEHCTLNPEPYTPNPEP